MSEGGLARPAPAGLVRGLGQAGGALLRLDVVGVVQALGSLPQVVVGVEAVLTGVGELLTSVAGTLARVDGLVTGVERTVGRVDPLVDDVAATVGRVGPIVDDVAATVRRVLPVVGDVEATVARVPAVLDTVDVVAERVTGLVAASDEIRGQIAAVVADLAPLLETAGSVDPRLLLKLDALLGSLPEVLGRVDTVVIPAVGSLEALVPTIGVLAAQVEDLQRVVGEVGQTLGGIPGAARLRKRAQSTNGGGTTPANPAGAAPAPSS